MLKKISYGEEKKCRINGIIESSNNFTISCFKFNNKKGWVLSDFSIEFWIQKMKLISSIYSSNLNELVCEIYGSSNDENDFEYLIAKILTIYFVIETCLNGSYDNIKVKNNKNAKAFLLNIQKVLTSYAPEYSFTFEKLVPPKYETTELKTVTDNIDNIDNDIADPIKQLLLPMKSEDELIGSISRVNSKLEKIKPLTLKNLNETDASIAKQAWGICMTTINNVDSAKGHKGNSDLSIKDIAHNFALNASLFFKLFELNKEKECQ